jgi:hypothetical protein
MKGPQIDSGAQHLVEAFRLRLHTCRLQFGPRTNVTIRTGNPLQATGRHFPNGLGTIPQARSSREAENPWFSLTVGTKMTLFALAGTGQINDWL